MTKGYSHMPVLITGDVPGQTQEGYDGMMAALAPALRQAQGFIAHGAGPIEGGWQVFEIWENQDDANRFFAHHIHPNLPPGIKPKRTFLQLHNFVQA